jgi:hypothetical protein
MKKKMSVFNFHVFIDHLDELANFCRTFLQESSFNPKKQSLSSACQQSRNQAQDFLRNSFVIRGKFLKRIFPNQGQDMSVFLMKIREENMAIFELISDEIDNEDKKFVMSTKKLCDEKLNQLVKLAEPIIKQFPQADEHLKRVYLDQAIKHTQRHGGMREEQMDLINFLRELPTILSALLICAQHYMELFFKQKSNHQSATAAYEKMLRFYNGAYEIGLFALNHASGQAGDINWAFFPFMVGMNAVESLILCLKQYPRIAQDSDLTRFMPQVEKYVRKYTCAEVNQRQKARLLLPLAMIYLQLGDVDKSNSFIKKLLEPTTQANQRAGYLESIYKLFDYSARLGLLQNYILFSGEYFEKIVDKNLKSRLMRNLNHIIIEMRQLLDNFDAQSHLVMNEFEKIKFSFDSIYVENNRVNNISIFDPDFCARRNTEWFYVNHVTYMLSLVQLAGEIPESELNFLVVQELLISFYKINKAIISLDNGVVPQPFRNELKVAYYEVIRSLLVELDRVDFSQKLIQELNQLSAKIDHELNRLQISSDQLFIELLHQYEKSEKKLTEISAEKKSESIDSDHELLCSHEHLPSLEPIVSASQQDSFALSAEKARQAWLKHNYKEAELYFVQARKSLADRVEAVKRSKLLFSWGVMLYCQAESDVKRFSSLSLELNLGSEYFNTIQRLADANNDNYHSGQIAKELSCLTPRVEKLAQLLSRSLSYLHEALSLLMHNPAAIKNINQAQEILSEYIQQTKEALKVIQALAHHVDEWFSARGHFIQRFHFDKKSNSLNPQAKQKHNQVGQVVHAFKETFTEETTPLTHLLHMQSLLSMQAQALKLIGSLMDRPEKSHLIPVLTVAINELMPLLMQEDEAEFFAALQSYLTTPAQANNEFIHRLNALLLPLASTHQAVQAAKALCFALDVEGDHATDSLLQHDLNLLRQHRLALDADFQHVPALQALQVWLNILGWQLTRSFIHQQSRVFTHEELLHDVTPVITTFEQRLLGHVRLGLAYAGLIPLEKIPSDRGFAVTMFNWVQAQSACASNDNTKALVNFSIFCLKSMPMTESSYGLLVSSNT